MFKNLCSMALVGTLAVAALLGGCKKDDGKKKIIIGMVAKSQSNDVFQAAYTGVKTPRRNSAPNTVSTSKSTGAPPPTKTPPSRSRPSKPSPAPAWTA
ncbi:MAG: hypothetical protein QM754_11960 [Tepidisphaeraceae bacterium]